MSRGFLRQHFEKAMKLTPEQTVLNAKDEYANPETHRMWRSFKAGATFTPNRGAFIVARIDGNSYAPVRSQPYADHSQARAMAISSARATGKTHAILHHIGAVSGNV